MALHLPQTLVLAGCALVAPVAAIAQRALPEPAIPQSVGVQLKHNNYDGENLDQVVQHGFHYVRRGFLWKTIETEKGTYDWTKYDAFMADAKARNLKVLGCLFQQNKDYGPHVKDEPATAGFAAFAAAAAERYADHDVIWEIWNEPNVRTFWGWHGKHNSDAYADEYLRLVNALVPAMRQADPDCTIVAGAVSGLWEAPHHWMKHAFEKGILDTGIDGWSVHPYSLKSPEDYPANYARMRANMVAAGAPADFPVINSERGYPLGKKEGFAGGDEALAKQYQAWHFVRQFLIDHHAGIRFTIWYEWSGKESFSLYNPDEPLPAATAAKFLTTRLADHTLAGRVELESDRDWVLTFTQPDGGTTLVAWTGPPENQTVDKIAPHDVTIPVEASGDLVTHDIYGTPGTLTVTDGQLTIPLTGSPLYIRISP